MSDLAPELQAIADAIQGFAVADEGDSVLVTQALVVYEVVHINDDGDAERRIAYTIPTDNFAISGAIGLAEAAKRLLIRDTLGSDDE